MCANENAKETFDSSVIARGKYVEQTVVMADRMKSSGNISGFTAYLN
jgi:hypothetical protein